MLFNASRGLSLSPHSYEGGGVSPETRLFRILLLILILESERSVAGETPRATEPLGVTAAFLRTVFGKRDRSAKGPRADRALNALA